MELPTHLKQSEIKVGQPVRIASTLSKWNGCIGIVVEAKYKQNKVEFSPVLSEPVYETFTCYQITKVDV